MKRKVVTGVVVGIGALVLAGCEAGKEPLARAGQLEAEGSFAEASKLYAETCEKAKDSPLCLIAKKRGERLRVKEGYKALDEGQFGKAKELFTAAAASEDPAVKRAATVALEAPELTAFLVWDEASAASDKAAARAKVEALAEGHTAVAPRAREWLAKNGPSVLLAEVKNACKPDGAGSCMELGAAMARRVPSSPEAAEAAKLVEDEYKRLQPTLRLAENLLIQRLEVYNKEAKVALCVEEKGGQDPEGECYSTVGVTRREIDSPKGAIDPAFDKRLAEIRDPGYVKAFRDRMRKIVESGEYDGEPWPKLPAK
jgi:hypothetical protein